MKIYTLEVWPQMRRSWSLVWKGNPPLGKNVIPSESKPQPSPPKAYTTSRIVIVRRQEHRPRVRIPWVKIPHLHRPLHRTRTPRPEIHKQHPKDLGRAARGLRHDVPGLHPVHADRGWKCALPDQDGDDVFGDGRRWGGGGVARYVVYGYGDGDVGQAEEAFLDEGFEEGGGVREVGCDEEVVGWDGHGGDGEVCFEGDDGVGGLMWKFGWMMWKFGWMGRKGFEGAVSKGLSCTVSESVWRIDLMRSSEAFRQSLLGNLSPVLGSSSNTLSSRFPSIHRLFW